MNKVLLAIGVILVIGGLAWQFLLPDRAAEVLAPDPASRVETTLGPVVGGRKATGGFAWLGIPYARAPEGELRWRAPQAPMKWGSDRLAVEHGPSCPQFASPLTSGLSFEAGEIVGSEDCLSLAVYAPPRPAGDASPLPVMFWIHGGGNTIGTGATYDGSGLAASENVVVVSINYRLGILGWLSHPALRESATDALDASGNFAVLDMVAALEWVRDNIARFGGDPGRVTIFGESAGGRNVFALLAAPQAAGLFHRAIAQSGLAGTSDLSRAENYADDPHPGHSNSSRELLVALLEQSGSASTEAARSQLEAMPAAEVMAYLRGMDLGTLHQPLYVEGGMYRTPQMFRDGTVMPAEPMLEVYADPARWNAVPLITGTTRDELKLFQFMDEEFVKLRFGILPRVRDQAYYDWRARWYSDRWRSLAVDEVARAISSAEDNPPVYAYRFDWDNMRSTFFADLPQLLGAAHSFELDFLFEPLISSLLPGMFHDGNAEDVAALKDTMRGYWGAFAHSGNPGRGSADDQPEWPAWQRAQGVMLLDGPEDKGVRHDGATLFAEDLKARLATDERLAELRRRCEMYVHLFLDNGGLDSFFDPLEYQAMDCAEFPPWSLAMFP